MSKLEKGYFSPILIIIILAVGIFFTVDLAQKQQIFKPKAAEGEPPECRQTDKPIIEQSCAECISRTRPGLLQAIQQQRAINCNLPMMMNLWCNGESKRDEQWKVDRLTGERTFLGYGDGFKTYNTSPGATRQCTETMTGACYQECKNTVLNTTAKCEVKAEDFPQGQLEPNTDYTFTICNVYSEAEEEWNHVSLRRDGLLQQNVSIGPGAGKCGGLKSVWKFNSGGAGKHNLQYSVNDTAIYQRVVGVDPKDQSKIAEARRRAGETQVNEAPRYMPRSVCLIKEYEVKGGTAGQQQPYNSCQQDIGLQTPDLGSNCTTCIAIKKPGLIYEIISKNSQLFAGCSNRESINYWCNGGFGDIAKSQCLATVQECSSVCSEKIDLKSAQILQNAQLKDLTISPNPLKLGDKLTIKGQITGGKIHVRLFPNDEGPVVGVEPKLDAFTKSVEFDSNKIPAKDSLNRTVTFVTVRFQGQTFDDKDLNGKAGLPNVVADLRLEIQ